MTNSSAGLAMAGAVAAGLCGGLSFFAIWRRAVPRAFTSRFWRTVPADVQGVLRSQDPDVMLAHYKALLVSLGAFSARNTLGLVLGLLPMGLLFLAVAALDPSSTLATETELHPPGLAAAQVPAAERRDGRLFVARSGRSDNSESSERSERPLRVAGLSLDGAALDGKLAICASPLACLVPGMLLFDTRAAELGIERGAILVRPRWFDANPLWPYVNDLELLFFVAAIGGSAAAAWAAKRGKGTRA
jgi:hypothetical protein